jgi:16S rRNA processing protein RimM
MQEYILFGKITKTHGILGAFVIDASLFENPEQYIENLVIKKEQNSVDFTVKLHGILNNNQLILTHKDISTIEEAKKLIGMEIFIERKSLKPLSDGEFYACDIIGFNVIDKNNQTIGTISDIVDFGGGVNIEVSTIIKNSKETLEYYPLDFNVKINFEEKTVSIILPRYV